MDRPEGSPEGRWFRDGDWHVWRERTTKPFSHIRIEATRTLFRGLAGLFTIHKWEGQTFEITGVGCSGDVRLEGVVLVELNDGRRTIIEKFEYYAGMCSFALALMTCDDRVAGSDLTEGHGAPAPMSTWRLAGLWRASAGRV